MAKVQMFRDFISKRLSAAAAEIFELFERTVSEYEEQLCRSKEENERQKKLLEAVYNPEVRLQRADIQQLWEGSEEVPPEQQETSSSSQFLQLHGIKTEENRDTEHFKTEADGEDCGGSESGFQEHLEEQKESPSEELSFSCPLCSKKFSRKKSLKVHLTRHKRMNAFSCSVCKKSFPYKREFETHMRIHTGEKPFGCSVCCSRFSDPSSLRAHLKTHTREKGPSKEEPTNVFPTRRCSVCNKTFHNEYFLKHLRIHTEEKPCFCPVCDMIFPCDSSLKKHMKVHSLEKPLE